jgi:hypothetical protein
MDLQSVVADHDITATATAGDIMVVSLNAGDSISLEATATTGAITQNLGTITAGGPGGGSLTMQQGDSLNTKDFTFSNQSNTDLTLESFNGTVTSDNTKPANTADKWQSITATAQHNIILSGDGDITANAMTSTAGNIEILSTGGDLIVEGPVNADANPSDGIGGGVSLISETGKIYTPDGTNTLNVDITGYSATNVGVDLDPAKPGSGEAAIVIRSKEDLVLGSNAQLTANGQYDPQQNDDRNAVGFDDSLVGGGDPIDVAIYLRTSQPYTQPDPPVVPSGIVTVESEVTIPGDGTMVVDAGEKVIFDGDFYKSIFDPTTRLEVVSRRSETLDEVITHQRLPHADDPEAIRNSFNETSTGYFAGAYVLRGVKTLLAEVLALTNPVPLVPPRPLEPEFQGEVEGPDTEALEKLLSDLGIGVQPYMTEAYANSLSTDLRLYKAAEKLQELMPVLEDVNGIHIAGLRETVAEYFPTLDVLSEEQMDSFAEVLAIHKGDGTNYDLAGQCIFALTEYVNILSTEIGWPVEKSVEFVMGRYVPRLTENDEIRIAVVQMHLQK